MPSMNSPAPRSGALSLVSVLLAVGAACAVVPAGAAETPPPHYRLERLQPPSAGYADIVALNNRGELAINVTRFDSGSFFYTPYVWGRGGYTAWGDRFQRLTDLSDHGDLVGYEPDARGTTLVYRDGRMTVLPGDLREISPNGQWLAGSAYDEHAQYRAAVFDGTRTWFPDPNPVEIQSYALDVNDRGVAVGGYIPDRHGGDSALVFDSRHTTLFRPLLPRSVESIGWAINNAGQATGSGFALSSGRYGFLYGDGVMTLLDHVGYDINDQGWIVGGDRLLRDGVSYLVNELIRPADRAHLSGLGLNLLNNAGQMAGFAIYDDGERAAVLLTPVPEPRAWALALVGLGALALVSRRRSQPTSG